MTNPSLPYAFRIATKIENLFKDGLAFLAVLFYFYVHTYPVYVEIILSMPSHLLHVKSLINSFNPFTPNLLN